MQRGEIYIYRDELYASKARPVVIVQSKSVDEFESVILCLMTSFDNENVQSRVQVSASPDNGLEKVSYVMTEKLFTVPKSDLSDYVGKLTSEQMSNINHELAELFHITKDEAVD